MMDELTGLENDFDYEGALDIIEDGSSVEPGSIDIPETDTTVDEYEEEQCTDSYFSNAYGQTYCIGDTIETAEGPMTVTSIWNGQVVTSPVEVLDADELYDDMGVAMGMTEEEFAGFIDSYNELKMEYAALDSSMHVLGPTEMQKGRLGIRVSQENPDWTPEQVYAEVERLLSPEIANAEAYSNLTRREQELFAQYGMSTNGATFGIGTWVSPDGTYYRFNGANGNWRQTSQDNGFLDYAVPIAIAVGSAIITAGGVGSISGVAGMPGWAAGGVKGAIGSAVSQGLVTGSVDPSSLLTAALMGGVGGLFSDLSAMDGSIFSDPTSLTGAADTAVEGLSQLLNIPYDEALRIAQGIATGVVTGNDMESIIAGAVGSYTQSQLMDMLKATYGDTINVDDWFKDGESNIPVDALEPIIGQIVGGVVDGTIDDPASWAQTIWDYFQAGGDIDFMLPDGVDIGSWFSGSFGCPEWAKTEQGNCIWDGISGWNPELDVLECMPGWDWDAGLRQCLPIPNPCGEGLIWDADLGECLPDLPDVLECMPGFEWDEGLRQCAPIPNPCGEGLIWDADLGECFPDINIECPANWDKDEDGVCIEPPMLCEEGYSWDVLRGCIPDINIECPDGWDKDEDGVCIEPEQLCEEGYSWDIFRGCIPDSEDVEDPEDPDIDIETPDIDIDLPSFESSYDFEMGPRAQQYAYTPFKPVEAQPVKEFADILTNPLL